MTDQSISILITTHNALDYLKLCVDSILSASRVAHQIVIYADGSRPATRAYLQTLEHHPAVRFRCEEQNLGITKALNRAARMADNPYLYFINDDMVFPPGFDTALLRHMRKGRVLTGTVIEPPRPGIRPRSSLIVRNFGLRHSEFDPESFRREAPKLAEERLEPGISYPFLIERDLFWRIGGVDERFHGPTHDPDLFYRIALSGAEMLRVGDSLCYHFGGRSLRFAEDGQDVSASWIVSEMEGKIAFLRKWGERVHHPADGIPAPGVRCPDRRWSLWRRCYIEMTVRRYRRRTRRRLRKLAKSGRHAPQ